MSETPSELDGINLDDVDSIAPDEELFKGAQTIQIDVEDKPSRAERRELIKSRRIRAGYIPPDPNASTDPSKGIPSLDEWMDFFSRVLIRLATDFYIDFAFRGVDENLLTDREIQSIKLGAEERDRIAKPFAEFANKNKFTRRHGREILATAGSIDAILQLGIWFSRVTRIANLAKRRSSQPAEYGNQAAYFTEYDTGTTEEEGVLIPNVSSRQSETVSSANGHNKFRPNVAGQVWNPGG